MNDFASFPLISMVADTPLPGNVYIFTAGHFIKYRQTGDLLEGKKIEEFLLKKVEYFFIEASEKDKFIDWSKTKKTEEVDEVVKAVGEENRDVVEKSSEAKDELMTFITRDITEESIKEMVEKTREVIQAVNKKHPTDKFLGKLRSRGNTLADHSSNVANLATFMALNIGYSHQILLENTYLGGLLHDFGKTKIKQEIIDLGPTNKSYLTAMAKHPQTGKTALLFDSGFHDDVLRIIVEHHERHDGKGFPRGIKGHRIFDLSKIVAIANRFDNLIRESTGKTLKAKHQMAFKKIEEDQGKEFDPKILAKCLRVLETVI